MKKYGIIIFICLGLILVGCTNKEVTPTIEKTTESVAKSFKELYPEVDDNHPFKETDIYKILEMFEQKETSIVFFGFPDCPKCHQVATVLSLAAENNAVKKIYYFNPLSARDNNTKEYRKLVDIIADILPSDEYGKKSLQVPLVLFIEQGQVKTYQSGSVNEAPVDKKILDEVQSTTLINIFDTKLKQMNLIDCNC